MSQEVVFDDKEVREFLNRVANKVKDPVQQKQIVGAISAIVFRDVIKHFEDESGPQGKWKPWSKIYAKRMAKLGRAGNKILQWNGRLRQNFQPTKYKIEPHALTWFNNAQTKGGYPYAWGHDTGDGKLPARPFMWLSPKAMDDISEGVLKGVLE